jgi:hypothetical protein
MITSNNILHILSIAQSELQTQLADIKHLKESTIFPLTPLNTAHFQRLISNLLVPHNRTISSAVIDDECQLLLDVLSRSARNRECSWETELLISKVYIYILDFCRRIAGLCVNKQYSWFSGPYRGLQCRSRIIVHTGNQYIAIVSRSLDAIGAFTIPNEIVIKHIPISACLHICEDNKVCRDTFTIGNVCTLIPGTKYEYHINTGYHGYQPYVAIELGSGTITNTVKSQIGTTTLSIVDRLKASFRRNVVHPTNLI